MTPNLSWWTTFVRYSSYQGRRRLIFMVTGIVVLYLFLMNSNHFVNRPEGVGGLYVGSIPSCADVCDISYKGSEPAKKNFKCYDIIYRMATNATGRAVINPAPAQPPSDLYDAYTMFGEMPIQQIYYFSEIYDSKPIQTISRQSMDTLARELDKGNSIGTYGLSCDRFVEAIVVNLTRPIDPDNPAILDSEKEPINIDADAERNPSLLRRLNGTRGFVIGSQKLWIEAILLAHGVNHVTTLEYATMVTSDERVAVVKPPDLAKHLLEIMPPPQGIWSRTKNYFISNNVKQQADPSQHIDWEPFDFGFTFSSLEHAGLGRYGDPLDPFGDLEAMAQAWCMTRPGGLFFMGLPVDLNRSYLVWNAHRIYGPNRVAQMAANWEIIAVVRNRETPTDYHLNTIYVLRKPLS